MSRFAAIAVLAAAALLPSATPGPTVTSTEIVTGAATDASSVERLYWAYFLRTPDPSGLEYWVNRWRGGLALEGISEEFARSEEFRARYGSVDDRAFVALVYDNVLARTPDETGFAYWTDRLGGGMRWGELMVGFSESDEFRARVDELSSPEPSGGSFAFLQPDRGDGTPTRWAPCERRPVVINPAGAPDGATDALRAALTRLSEATGIDWYLAGTTSARAVDAAGVPRDQLVDPTTGRPAIVVSWATQWGESGAVGIGLFGVERQGENPAVATFGQVVLDPSWGVPSTSELRALFLHEFGHVAGLAHVDDASELMHPNLGSVQDYAAGDLAGLAHLGASGSSC